MKLTKKYLRKLIKEAIVEAEDSKELDLRLTQKDASVLLLALESLMNELHEEPEDPERDPEDEREKKELVDKAADLYVMISDAGLDDMADEWPTDLETRAAEQGADSDDVARAEEEGY